MAVITIPIIVALSLLELTLVAGCVVSWLALDGNVPPGDGCCADIVFWILQFTDSVLAPLRQYLPSGGRMPLPNRPGTYLDWSPVVALIGVDCLRRFFCSTAD